MRRLRSTAAPLGVPPLEKKKPSRRYDHTAVAEHAAHTNGRPAEEPDSLLAALSALEADHERRRLDAKPKSARPRRARQRVYFFSSPEACRRRTPKGAADGSRAVASGKVLDATHL